MNDISARPLPLCSFTSPRLSLHGPIHRSPHLALSFFPPSSLPRSPPPDCGSRLLNGHPQTQTATTHTRVPHNLCTHRSLEHEGITIRLIGRSEVTTPPPQLPNSHIGPKPLDPKPSQTFPNQQTLKLEPQMPGPGVSRVRPNGALPLPECRAGPVRGI